MTMSIVMMRTTATAVAAGPDWGPPLGGYQGLTSTFGEFRPTHLHAGVDLSTGGRNGLPVLAAADGEVYRLLQTYRGFGQAVFVRHAGGFVSVYGHLAAFSARLGLDGVVRAGRGPDGYAGDVLLDKPVPVKKGEEIGLSGETGEGLPHLHFEILDAAGRPVNPCVLEAVFEDRDPPVLEKITLDPSGAGSAVNGGRETLVLVPSAPVKAPVVLRGTIRPRLVSHDLAGAGSPLGLFSLEVFLDGKTAMRERFESFPRAKTYQVGTVIDPLASHLSPTVYAYNLYRDRGNSLPLTACVSPLLEGGLNADTLPPGRHRLEIKAGDAAGNENSFGFDFVVNHPPEATVEADGSGGGPGRRAFTVVARDADGFPGGDAGVIACEYSGDGGLTWKKAVPAPAAGGGSEPGLARAVCAVPESGRGVQLRARAWDGFEHSPWVRSPLAGPRPASPAREGAASMTLRERGGWAEIAVRRTPPAWENPTVLLTGPGGKTVTLATSWKGGDAYEAAWPYTPGHLGAWEASLPGAAGPGAARAAFEVLPVGASGGRVGWDGLEAVFPVGALYGEAYVRRAPSKAKADPALRQVSPAWRMESTIYPFDKPAVLGLKPDRPYEDRRRVGIYVWDAFRGLWRFAGAEATGDGTFIGVAVRHFSDYVLMEDTAPPVIGVAAVRRAVHPAGGREITVGLSDRGMGVDNARLKIALDGQAVTAEYDPDRNLAVAAVPPEIKPGRHRLDVDAFDLAGNASTTRKLEIVLP